ncbi:hypothetical protein HPB48_004647 [Haemaphysalis longicornis]|uniref:UPAR/Ly6 domain-containing protein qvr n=1 Tax=Haemaphysalis longicornis TaxID=44386 RepID=A0A9J6G2Q2_HAELO|nr:hypothetical protein HPB48_004647 [Haemaphysalis longicornis]
MGEPHLTRHEGAFCEFVRVTHTRVYRMRVLADSRIQCYDCNSEQEPRCRDPFNHSEENRPTLRECQGCCVKIVKRHGKHDQEVRRTCTERLQINMFLVDHVCMYESGGGGHMCFCESDACNAAPPPPAADDDNDRPAAGLLLPLPLLLRVSHGVEAQDFLGRPATTPRIRSPQEPATDRGDGQRGARTVH